MKSRNLVLMFLIVTFVILTFVAIFITSPQSAQKKSQNGEDPPTLFQPNGITEKQKEHQKLYKQPDETRSLVSKSTDIEKIILLPWKEKKSDNNSFSDLLKEKTCNADIIIVGSVNNKVSLFTENKDFIFTDYELNVNQVIENKNNLSVYSGSILTITRPGGSILFEGQTIKVKDRSYHLLKIGREYILFLKLIPSTGGFKALDSESSFELMNNKLIALTDQDSNLDQADVSTVINQLQSVVGNCKSEDK